MEEKKFVDVDFIPNEPLQKLIGMDGKSQGKFLDKYGRWRNLGGLKNKVPHIRPG